MNEPPNENTNEVSQQRQTPIDEVIAEERLIFVTDTKQTFALLQIGRPYIDGDGVARCPIAAWGIDDRYPDIAGETTFQALCLGVRFLERMIRDYVTRTDAAIELPAEDASDHQGEDESHPISRDSILAAIFGSL